MSRNELMLDVSQAEELKLAFRRCGWNNAIIKALCEGDFLSKVLKVLKGQAEIKIIENLIDCDADPFIPEGFTVGEHKKGGFFKFDPKNIFLYLSKKQRKGSVCGNYLRQELLNKKVLNANVLDYLLAHPELIPEKWKNKATFFWGTIYRHSNGSLCVRCLYRYGSKWYWNSYCFSTHFYIDNPAAIAS